jgi:dipeptidyl aminopeptidase/acylaminoacyl peptidase
MTSAKRHLLIGFLALAGLLSHAQSPKKPLDHDVYDGWKTLGARMLSDDGKWVAFTINPQVGDGMLFVRRTNGGVSHQIERGSGARFAADMTHVLLTISPPKADVDKAKKEKKKPEEMPKNALGILNLATGKVTRLERLKSFRLADEDSGWFSYQTEPEKKPDEPKPPADAKPEGKAEAKPTEPQKPKKKASQTLGSELILRNLSTGKELKLKDVLDYQWSKDGKFIVYTVSAKDGEGDGLYLCGVDGTKTAIQTGLGNYRSIVLHADTKAIAFLCDRDSYADEEPSYKAYLWRPGDEARVIAKAETPGIPKDWKIADRGLRFSDKGTRLFLATLPKSPPEPKEPTPDDEKVTVDIWNWKDPLIQPMQLVQAAREKARTYEAFVEIASGKLTQLETPEIPSVTVAAKGEGNYALGSDDQPYRPLVSWDQGYSDVYLFDLSSGASKKILAKAENTPSFSPSGKYATWFDDDDETFYALETATGKILPISKAIPTRLVNELNDVPALPNAYGAGGWLDGEKEMLIFDAYDIWAVDPTGARPARCVTEGFGRRWHIRFRPQQLDPERQTYDPAARTVLVAFDTDSKASGFYSAQLGLAGPPKKLLMQDKSFSGLTKAKKADLVLYTRKSFSEYPDLWANNLNLDDPIRLSDTNPQQAEYNWGTAELVSWTSNDGIPLQGVLCKPEDFDPGKKYPMIVYFYERLSDTLHNYYGPGPGGGSISPSFYVSRGYLVFQPDIPYRIGYPGASAMSAIMPGVQSLIARGIVNPKAIGLNGYSWGGYQIAYMITQTDMFAAAMAGAPVSNMVSAYGGIRWESGMVREFQYEKTQSRIGGTLWERPLQFLENSPIFWADKVHTPVLINANDNDGAVPWYQGIELFAALRRLGRPAWMLNYNGEGHGISKRPNQKDFAVRQQQFYDHFLKGAPAPVWLTDGVPAAKKGKELGLEIKKKG